MKTLVSLVSAQTIPNILFIKQTLSEFDDYIFISTSKMIKMHKTEAICKATGINFNEKNRIEVIEDSIEDITNKLIRFYNKDIDYVINITGGNKIMFLAVYNFFNEKDVPIYYKPIDKLIFKQLNGENEIPITINLSVEEYLYAHDIVFTNKKSHYKYEKTEKYFNEYKNLNYSISALQKQYPPNKKYEVTGKWFELYCYYKIKKTLELSDNQIALNVKVKNNEDIVNGKNDNEFDIIFVKNNQLFVIEAKVSVNENKLIKNINPYLFKLSALNKNFGLRSHAFIFTLAEIWNKSDVITDDLNRKLKILGIKKIFDRNIIANNDKFINEIQKM